MKKLYALLFLLTVIACGSTKLSSPPMCSIDFYGDSILAGWYLRDKGKETPAQMFKRMRAEYTINDQAVGGEKAIDRVKVFDGGRSRITVIEHGTNDGGAYARQEPGGGEGYEDAMRTMIRMAQKQGRIVIVTGLSQQQGPLEWVDLFNEKAKDVAAETGAGFADWHSVPSGDMVDYTHPDSEFTERLVIQLIKSVDTVAPECSPSPM